MSTHQNAKMQSPNMVKKKYVNKTLVVSKIPPEYKIITHTKNPSSNSTIVVNNQDISSEDLSSPIACISFKFKNRVK